MICCKFFSYKECLYFQGTESRETFLVTLSAENYANTTIEACIEDDDGKVL